jgi:hypothetical protein
MKSEWGGYTNCPQERCDRIFLSLFLLFASDQSTNLSINEVRNGPRTSVGKSAFRVFLLSLGTSNMMLFLQEHTIIVVVVVTRPKRRKTAHGASNGCTVLVHTTEHTHTLEFKVFVKPVVTVTCKEKKPPIDITLRLEELMTD